MCEETSMTCLKKRRISHLDLEMWQCYYNFGKKKRLLKIYYNIFSDISILRRHLGDINRFYELLQGLKWQKFIFRDMYFD